MKKIVLTGGGTAGHCTPNLALIPYLKKKFDSIIYIGSKNGIEKNIVTKEEIPYFEISCAKVDRYKKSKNILIPFKVIKGIVEAGKILDKEKPSVVFSKGGYVSIPTVIAAYNRKIPVISHESDYTFGLANKLIAKFSKVVLTSFPETATSINNAQYVGSPIRKFYTKEKTEILKEFGFTGNKPIILVTGGSQGSRAINDTLRESLPDLLQRYDVLHICGKNNLSPDVNYKGYYQTEYLYNIENAFLISSVCVSRAGANTLFELMNMKIPCILIPLPKGASRGDQVLNAEYFQKKGLAQVLPQHALTKQSLLFNINSVYANRLNIARNFSKNQISDQSEKIANIIADFALWKYLYKILL